MGLQLFLGEEAFPMNDFRLPTDYFRLVEHLPDPRSFASAKALKYYVPASLAARMLSHFSRTAS